MKNIYHKIGNTVWNLNMDFKKKIGSWWGETKNVLFLYKTQIWVQYKKYI